jgi:hypothetical protein
MDTYVGLLVLVLLWFSAFLVLPAVHVSAEHDAAQDMTPAPAADKTVHTFRRGELGRSVKVDLHKGKVKP